MNNLQLGQHINDIVNSTACLEDAYYVMLKDEANGLYQVYMDDEDLFITFSDGGSIEILANACFLR